MRQHADISDGVNEYGLAAQKLTFSNQSDYASEGEAGKIQLAAFEFLLWLLGNCRSIEEVRQKIDTVQLMTDENSTFKFGRNDLHFSATDSSGQMINIEPHGGRLIISNNSIGVVTNAPKFEREVEKLTTYMDLNILTEPSVRNNPIRFRLGVLMVSQYFLVDLHRLPDLSGPLSIKKEPFILKMNSKILLKLGIF